MAVNLAKMGETKVTVPLILLGALLVFGWKAKDFTVGTLDEFFFSEAEASQLAEAVTKNTETLTNYIRRQDLRDVNSEIAGVTNQIQETQLWIEANGQNPIATARLQELVERKNKLEAKKACLLNDNIEDKSVCEEA
jgi:hypothetical protein